MKNYKREIQTDVMGEGRGAFFPWRIFSNGEQECISEAYWTQLSLEKDEVLANTY